MIKIAALTYNGVSVAEKIQSNINDSEVFVNNRISEKFNLNHNRFESIKEFVNENWNATNAFVFIMSTGIVVRSIAHLLKDKKNDPAVVVIDEKGKNVISLLSGHLGGANDLTLKIAKLLNANPVITTASDVNQLPAFDEIARQNNFYVKNLKNLKNVAVKILEKEEVKIYSDIDVKITLPDNLKFETKLSENIDLIISEKNFETDLPQLVPNNVVVGLGCRKDTSYETINMVLKKVLTENRIETNSICKIATVPLKANEKGILKLVEEMYVELEIIPFEAIKKIEDDFEGSEFVESITGVKAVAEPSAYLAAREPEIIAKRYASEGVTIALVKDKSICLEGE